jgi:hypothetical protein
MGVLIMLLTLAQASPAEVASIQVKGEYVEPLSKVSFPETIGEWIRAGVLRYPAPPGSNHSVEYELRRPGGTVRARATVYVFSQEEPIPPALADHFSTTLEELAAHRTDFELVSQGPLTLHRAGRTFEARMAMFILRRGFGDYPQPVISQLILLRNGGYWIKWRVTTPGNSQPDVPGKVSALVDAMLPAQ